VEHALAALVRDPRGGSAGAVAALGVTSGQVERELRARLQRVERSEQAGPKRKEKPMPDEQEREEMTEEELEVQIGAALPDREVMSSLPITDPTGGVSLPIPHQLDEPDGPPPEKGAEGDIPRGPEGGGET
jgi:hypothetical protein